jgi:glucose/arabinose dehydrogenase
MRGFVRTAALAVCGATWLPAGGTAHAQSIADLWSNNCSTCHGARGQGGGAGTRTLLDDEKFHQKFDRPFFEAIRDGVEGSAMTGFSKTLTEQQMWGLVVHIRELQSRDRRARLGSPKESAGIYQTSLASYEIETVVENGIEVPWAVDFLPPGGEVTGMLVTERPGPVRVFADGTLSSPIEGTPKVRNRGQGGMMDVAVHPAYATNGWVYLAFSDDKQQGGGGGRSVGMTKVVRGKIIKKGDAYAWTDQQTIFEAKEEHYLRTDLHFGVRVVFQGPQSDGRYYTFFGIGERGMGDHAQTLQRPNGKVHRLWDDGTVPTDNPFVGREGVYESIWSYGHRNPQGLVFDLTGSLWDTEHGPRGGDEVNLIQRAANYGWPEVSFGMNYDGSAYRTPWSETTKDGSKVTMPADRWLPSIGACGLDVMRGEAFPAWKGDLMAGGLSGANVDRIRVKDGAVVERDEIFHGHGRVRDVVCGPDGMLYIVLNDPDTVVRLVPSK